MASLKKHFVHSYPGTGSGSVINGIEAASQSFKSGDLVYFNSSKLTACASDGTAIAGIAMADATGVTDSIIPFIPISQCILEMSTYEASNAGTKYVHEIIGVNYALSVSNGQAYCDLDDTGHDALVVISMLDPEGTAYGRVLCKVLAAADQCSIGT